MKSPRTWIAGVGGLLLVASLLTACSAQGAGGTSSTAPAKSSLKCGAGTGKKATGTPITFGALVTNQPGLTGFTDDTDAAQAYFDCVNANGGVDGHPIQYIVKQDTTDPSTTSTYGTALMEQNKVDALVGGFSILDCAVNEKLRQSNGYKAIGGAIDNSCFNSPTFAPVNIGSANSALATAQFLIQKKHVKKLIVASSNAPGADLVGKNVIEYSKENGVSAQAVLENVPIADPQGLALRLTQAVGQGGGVIINFNPGETVKLMNAIQQQNLIDSAVWGCPAGCYSSSLIKNVGPAWNDKLYVNSELNALNASGVDSALMRNVMAAYAPQVEIDSYSQFGWVAATAAVAAIQHLPESKLNKQGINAAFAAFTGFKSTLLCRPWYYGSLSTKLADNEVRISDFANGSFSQVSGCTPLPATSINHLSDIRAWESSHGL